MKKSQYKGTPHPKKRRPLDVITNNNHDVASVKTIDSKRIDNNANDGNCTPLKHLHVVHSSVARLLEKIDSLVTGIHKKKLAEKLTVEEIDNFSRAMSTMECALQEWHDFILQVAKRPNVPESRRCEEQQVYNNNLIPIKSPKSHAFDSVSMKSPKSHAGVLSDSPLVPAARDDSRKVLHFTPQLSASRRKAQVTPVISSMKKVRFTPQSSTSKKVTFAIIPETITPSMPSPPQSVRLRRPSMSSSSSSCLSTPSFIHCAPQSPDLATPQAPADMVKKYPKLFSKSSGGKQSDKTSPGISPPKTCALLRPIGSSGGQDSHSPIALPPLSPFRTPGLMLRSPCKEDSPVSATGVTSKLATMNL